MMAGHDPDAVAVADGWWAGVAAAAAVVAESLKVLDLQGQTQLTPRCPCNKVEIF